jgi:hypothetical protein
MFRHTEKMSYTRQQSALFPDQYYTKGTLPPLHNAVPEIHRPQMPEVSASKLREGYQYLI